MKLIITFLWTNLYLLRLERIIHTTFLIHEPINIQYFYLNILLSWECHFRDICHALILKSMWLFYVPKLNISGDLTRCSSSRCVTSATTHQRQTAKSHTTFMVFTKLLILMRWSSFANRQWLSRWRGVGPVLGQLFLSVTTIFSVCFYPTVSIMWLSHHEPVAEQCLYQWRQWQWLWCYTRKAGYLSRDMQLWFLNVK